MSCKAVVATLNESLMSHSSNDSLCWLSSHRCGRSVLPQRTTSSLASFFELHLAMSGGDLTVLVPQKLIADVNKRRQICPFWKKFHAQKARGVKNPTRCRNGARCKFRHANDETMDSRIAYISWDKTKDGRVIPHLRPPQTESLNKYFETQGFQGAAFKLLGGSHSMIEHFLIYIVICPCADRPDHKLRS